MTIENVLWLYQPVLPGMPTIEEICLNIYLSMLIFLVLWIVLNTIKLFGMRKNL
jgi:hypothetical protein